MGVINYLKDIIIKGYDGSGYPALNIDKSTRAQTTIDYQHHETHDGSHFFVHDYGTFSSGSAIMFSVKTSATPTLAHMLFDFVSNGPFEVQVYENSTFTGGVAVTPINSRRDSIKTSVLTIAQNPSLTATGNLLMRLKLGSTGVFGGASEEYGRENELILAPNSDYIWHIQAHDTTVVINFHGHWYEHADK